MLNITGCSDNVNTKHVLEFPGFYLSYFFFLIKMIVTTQNHISITDECFRFMKELPEKYHQLSIFDVIGNQEEEG